MPSQRYYYSVWRRYNNQSTTLVPGDTFYFDIKVVYHSINTGPDGLQHRFTSRSISYHEFFQEGQDFLYSLLSSTSFSIQSLEEITEGVVSTIRELFQESGDAAFLRLESQGRVIPLSVRIIILSYAATEERQYSRENDASNEAKIKTFLKECRVMRGSEDCSICLEEFNINAECYTMPCHHAFHLPCILTWLKTRPLCPMCRYSLPTLDS